MPLITINTGSTANSGTGDNLRVASAKVNNNFLYLSSSITTKGFNHANPPQGLARITGSFIITGSITSSGDLEFNDLYSSTLYATDEIKVNNNFFTENLTVNYISASDTFWDGFGSYYDRPPTLRLSGSGDESPSLISFDIYGWPSLVMQANTMSAVPNDIIYPAPNTGPGGGTFFPNLLKFISGENLKGPFGIALESNTFEVQFGLGSATSADTVIDFNNTAIIKADKYIWVDSITSTANISPTQLKYQTATALGGSGTTKVVTTHIT